MIALPKTPVARITLAIAVSVLVHLALLFTPMITLPPAEIPLPPLQAELEPLPKIAAAKPKPKPRARPHVAKPVAPPIADALSVPSSAVEATAAVEAVSAVEAASAVAPVSAVVESAPLHPLPKKAQLAFAVYKGTRFRVGDARLRFEIADDKSYTIKVEANTTGIVSLFKKFDLTWTSRGTLTTNGLKPDEYSDARVTGSGQESRSARFNWMEKTLSFSAGNSVALPDGSQDRVSFMFQMSQTPWSENNIALNISDGSKLDRYDIDIGSAETIDTRMGKIHALPFRKRHAAKESYLDIWLGEEYRLLPVKIRQTDSNGNIEYEMVVTEIRVSDE